MRTALITLYSNIKVGMRIERLLAGRVKMDLDVTGVTEQTIVCGPWVFDKKSGMEIDEDLGWGPQFGRTGSYIKGVKDEENK